MQILIILIVVCDELLEILVGLYENCSYLVQVYDYGVYNICFIINGDLNGLTYARYLFLFWLN